MAKTPRKRGRNPLQPKPIPQLDIYVNTRARNALLRAFGPDVDSARLFMYLLFQDTTDWDSDDKKVFAADVAKIVGVPIKAVGMKNRITNLSKYGVLVNLIQNDRSVVRVRSMTWPTDWWFVNKLLDPNTPKEKKVWAFDGAKFDPNRSCVAQIKTRNIKVEPVTQSLLDILETHGRVETGNEMKLSLLQLNENLVTSRTINCAAFYRNQTLITRFCDSGHERYVTVGNTNRIFPTSISGASREVRKAAQRSLGLLSLDVSASQMRIIRALWKVESLGDYLDGDVSFWTRLLGECGIQPHLKPVVKTLMYAIVFGRSERFSRYDAGNELGSTLSARLHNHPVVKEIFRRREEYFDDIRRNGSGEDAFGNIVPMRQRKVESLAAQFAQSWEHKLTAEAALACHGLPGVTLKMFLHDGFAISSDGSVTQRQILQVAVQAANLATQPLNLNIKFDIEN